VRVPAIAACAVAAALASASALAGAVDQTADLTAEQIVEKSVAARGGLDAWRKIQTMTWSGHIETGNPSTSSVEFVLEQKRPNKTRFETTSPAEKTVRLFDGTHGWKVVPVGGGSRVLRRFTPLELRSARDAQGIDGLLIDYEARGSTMALEGTDDIEGRKAYRLNVRLSSGSMRRVWVDAQTFLEVKHERQTRAVNGGVGSVSVFYRDYCTIGGVRLPLTIESVRGSVAGAAKMVIDSVTLNPSLSDAHFGRPDATPRVNRAPMLRSQSPSRTDEQEALAPQ
jgi:hypothetical protein